MGKILILYTSVGLGHKIIAENIGWQLENAGFEVKLTDVLEEEKGRLVEISKKIHWALLTRFLFAWRFLYNNKIFIDLSLPLRYKVARKKYGKVKQVVENFQPDMIITTQTSASAQVAVMKQTGEFKGIFGIAFSDFHLHRYWLYKEADFYLANTKEQKEEMIFLGEEANKIFVCGITLKPEIKIDTKKIKEKFKIKLTDKVVLFGSGSLGLSGQEKIIRQLCRVQDLKVIVLCGKNKTLLEKVKDEFAQDNIIVLPFYSPVEELYGISDVFVSKPGGLSFAESLRLCLPVVTSHTLPGGEDWNLSYLLGKCLVIDPGQNIVNAIRQEIETANFKKSLLDNPARQELLKGEISVSQAASQMFDKLTAKQ